MQLIKAHPSLPRGHAFLLLTPSEFSELRFRTNEHELTINDLLSRLTAAMALNAPMPPQLREREQEVGLAAAQGLSNKEIATELGISDQTVKNCLVKVFDAYGAKNKAQLALAMYGRNGQGATTAAP